MLRDPSFFNGQLSAALRVGLQSFRGLDSWERRDLPPERACDSLGFANFFDSPVDAEESADKE
ncbi:MAG: hypothetical protein DWH91_16590 [Planctomycetota bacterium]|nr:MAG: hypothetical protein DWH91_16590 [Planctomycetota bacterium]